MIIFFGAERVGIFGNIGPALRFNLFAKATRIFTAIGAKDKHSASLLLFMIVTEFRIYNIMILSKIYRLNGVSR